MQALIKMARLNACLTSLAHCKPDLCEGGLKRGSPLYPPLIGPDWVAHFDSFTYRSLEKGKIINWQRG